jgi:protein-arginine kinase activator protein McsA
LSAHPYFRKRIALTTKHEKLRLIKPAFDESVGCELFEVNLDTDKLGTFSGEIERIAPPLETAIQKARLGMKETGILIGIASEGSVGPDPIVPFIHSSIEHLVLVDDEIGIVISETYRSFDITAAAITAAPGQDLTSFLKKADFPNHALIVRPNTQITSNCIKGINNHEQLMAAIEKISKHSYNGFVVLESDLRAMHSPTRQRNIEEVAKLLVKRVSQLCPNCQIPGWGRVGYEKGLNCSECELNNPDAIRQEKLGCVKCDHTELGRVLSSTLNPAQCNFCNP